MPPSPPSIFPTTSHLSTQYPLGEWESLAVHFHLGTVTLGIVVSASDILSKTEEGVKGKHLLHKSHKLHLRGWLAGWLVRMNVDMT